MKESALKFEIEEAPILIETTPPVQELDLSDIIIYEPAPSSQMRVELPVPVEPPVPLGPPVRLELPKRATKNELRRRRKLILFVKLEVLSFFFLILMLAGATNDPMQKAGFGTLFETGMVAAALIVAIIPVFFYGSTREKYRYRSRRYRTRA